MVGELPELARKLARTFWPGPLTLVIPIRKAGLVPAVTSKGETVAVRVPAHLVARAVASAAGGLVSSTSANRSGEPPTSTAEEVMAELGGKIALVIDGGPTPAGHASTIIDVTGERPRLVRPGRVPFDRVLESLQ
jgi:L-threonylcarbamoyladenylate synthase